MAGKPVALEGAANFRDLGGLPASGGARVRSGRVYRSDALHRLSPKDLGFLRDDLRIDLVFDLRSLREVETDGVGPLASRLRRVHVPLVEQTLSPFDPDVDWRRVDLRDRYLEMLHVGGSAIRTVLDALAAPDARPLVFHCTGGKDRTGVLAAVLLRLLGVSDDDIIEDYAASQVHLRRMLEAYRGELAGRGLDGEAIAYLTSSPPQRMRYTLAQLDRQWGSAPRYAAELGIGEVALERLRLNLLEDS